MEEKTIIRRTDVPEDALLDLIKDYKLIGFEVYQQFRQPNGLWTLEVHKPEGEK